MHTLNNKIFFVQSSAFTIPDVLPSHPGYSSAYSIRKYTRATKEKIPHGMAYDREI